MLKAYRDHVAERAALGIPPLPLTAQQLPVEHLPVPAMQALYRQWKTLHDPE